MANELITSYFASGGTPATGLSATLKVWEVLAGSHTLIVNGDSMTEVGDGFYKYDFATFDSLKDYVIIADAGAGKPSERFSVGSIGELEVNLDSADLTNITDAIWNVDASTYLSVGSTGYLLNQISADTTQIRIDVVSAISLIETLLKYQENRTKIDKTAKTLTIYDNDGTTPLKVFDLKDDVGDPSVTEVCERLPQP